MRRLAGALSIRPGEGMLMALVCGLFALVEAGRGIGEIAGDTLLLSRSGAQSLPYLYVGLGLVSLTVAVAYGAALGTFRRRPLLVGLLALLAAVLVAGRLAIMTGATLVLPALWLAIYATGAILLTFLWTVAGSILDARQAKRLFPICTSAAILGALGGTLLAGPLTRIIGAEDLLLVYAGALGLAALITARVLGRYGRPTPARARLVSGSVGAQLRVGSDYVRRSPLMLLVAAAYVLFAVLGFSVTFSFLRTVAAAFPSEADLATVLGVLSAAVTATSFVLSVVVAPRFNARFGVATAALALPLVYVAGFAVWLVRFGLETAVGVRFVQQVVQRGISNAAWSAMYNVVPGERRAQVLAFIDGVPGQLGTILSGLLLIAAGVVLGASQVFALGAIAAVACTVVVLGIRRRYGEALVRTLRAGLAEQVLEGGAGLEALGRDPRVLRELRASLGSPDERPGVRRLAAELLGRLRDRGARDALLAALADPDAAVRAASVDALAAIDEPPGSAGALAPLLADPEPPVRAAVVRALCVLDGAAVHARWELLASDPSPLVRGELAVSLVASGDTARAMPVIAALLDAGTADEVVAGLTALARSGGDPRSLDLVTPRLSDREPRVRAAALGALDRLDRSSATEARLAGFLDDGAATVRQAAARALRQRPGTARTVLDVLRTGSGRAQEAALDALVVTDRSVRDPLRDWALAQVERATRLREAADALGRGSGQAAPDDEPSLAFLRFVLARRERQVIDRLLGAIALLGAPEANGLVRRCLHSPDPDVRSQAIEALDALGDGRLGRAIVRLLDAGDAGPVRDAQPVLRSLTGDPDAWVRALALRTLAAHLSAELAAVARTAAADPAAAVRTAVQPYQPHGGSAMPDTDRTLGELERMLFLRRVPLFSELTPEDLQRIADTSTERLYAAGEALVREGELGDELVVIVEGTVRVERVEVAGTRILRSYTVGDHVGELAVLREQPRAATVTAADGPVRGLVIGGESLRSILRERPEAAMAMLATLAERISAQ